MNSAQSLALYQELIPRLAMQRRSRKFKHSDAGYIILNELDTISIFDCRALPTAFIDDTGDAAFEELKQTKESFVLPFDRCYLEFADEPRMIYASAYTTVMVDDLAMKTMSAPKRYAAYTSIKRNSANVALLNPIERDFVEQHTTYLGHEIEIYDLKISALFNGCFGELMFGEPAPEDKYEFFRVVNQNKRATREHWEAVVKRVLAVGVLLTEQMLIDENKPDPMPRISRERRRTQKMPVSGDTHVLTINVPVVRYQAKRNTPADGTHESPPLHWRRGHWRVYHRGSNSETTGWVRRCLVGDPSKGYIRKTQYRLVHRPVPLRVVKGY